MVSYWLLSPVLLLCVVFELDGVGIISGFSANMRKALKEKNLLQYN